MATPPQRLSGIAAKLLIAYAEWHIVMTKHVPKSLRYSLGIRIDSLFADLVAAVSGAQFIARERRPERIASAIALNDTLKFMLYALLELKGVEEKAFLSLSQKLEEIGRMLYGWKQKTQSMPADLGNRYE